ncbi:hypothetical protein POTOM_016621 [Populus tomentosa]|uniref:Retrotransposon Copia-like N-terminal domain-containing protein n=1 Tax=Populus tomentosa TaxID=118781 RepID=A0A8X7ZXC7_POPTO|nr:hypothetical protein POTOM_016621 [Populus tomentosa]
MATQTNSADNPNLSNPTMSTNSTRLHSNDFQLITINTSAQAPLKLTSSNYISWKLQFQTLFIGYDILGYIDGSKPCPSATILTDHSTIPNPAYHIWIRQDQLILNALIGSLSPTLIPFVARSTTSREAWNIIGSLSPTLIPFVARSTTSREAWNILANTYAKPSRGRIKQVKALFKQSTKGNLNITDFLQSVKARADELAILGAPIDEEDLTEKILDELDDDYKELVLAIQARDHSISFDELHEKLLTFEAMLQGKTKSFTHFPVGARHTILIHVPVIIVHHHVHTWAIVKYAALKDTQPKGVHHFK